MLAAGMKLKMVMHMAMPICCHYEFMKSVHALNIMDHPIACGVLGDQ